MAHDGSVFSNLEQAVVDRLATLEVASKFKLIHSFPGTLVREGPSIDPDEFFGPQNPNLKVMVTPVLARKETDDRGDWTVEVTCFVSVHWQQAEAIARLGSSTKRGMNGLVQDVIDRLDDWDSNTPDDGGAFTSDKLQFNRSRLMYQEAGRWIMELVFNDIIVRT